MLSLSRILQCRQALLKRYSVSTSRKSSIAIVSHRITSLLFFCEFESVAHSLQTP